MRLIDADVLIENKFKNPISYNAFVSLVKRQTTVDAVQVVRCVDCKYFRNPLGCSIGCGECMKGRRLPFVDFDWYYADGEREDDDNV